MDRWITFLLPIAGIGAAIVPLSSIGADVADASVGGAWSVNIKSQYRTRDTTMEIVQKGTALTGHIADSAGEKVPLTGTIKGNTIALSYELTGIQVNGIAQPMLKFNGTVDGNNISAKADQPVVGVMEMKAARKK